jgi:hypothetical protein
VAWPRTVRACNNITALTIAAATSQRRPVVRLQSSFADNNLCSRANEIFLELSSFSSCMLIAISPYVAFIWDPTEPATSDATPLVVTTTGELVDRPVTVLARGNNRGFNRTALRGDVLMQFAEVVNGPTVRCARRRRDIVAWP